MTEGFYGLQFTVLIPDCCTISFENRLRWQKIRKVSNMSECGLDENAYRVHKRTSAWTKFDIQVEDIERFSSFSVLIPEEASVHIMMHDLNTYLDYRLDLLAQSFHEVLDSHYVRKEGGV